MSDSYKDEIYDIAVNTFEVTCYMFPMEEWELEEIEEQALPENGIRSVVGFNGAAEGQMIITPSNDLLSAIAANMLGVDNPDKDQKAGALCEIANIICGNTVPLFAGADNICYIEPPRIVESNWEAVSQSDELHKELLQIYLDEGRAEIRVHYSIAGEA